MFSTDRVAQLQRGEGAVRLPARQDARDGCRELVEERRDTETASSVVLAPPRQPPPVRPLPATGPVVEEGVVLGRIAQRGFRVEPSAIPGGQRRIAADLKDDRPYRRLQSGFLKRTT